MELQDIVDKIGQLQQSEENLYSTLTQNSENVALGNPNTLSDEEIENITTQINNLSAARVNLYNFISDTYNAQNESDHAAQSSLEQQTKTLRILEKELNKSKQKMAELQDEKQNQLKMIEINTYYSKQYNAYKRLMQLITIVGICLLVSIFLDYTPLQIISKPLSILICIIGGFLIVRRILSMSLRKNDNYDEFYWFNTPSLTYSVNEANAENTNKIIDISGVSLDFICAESSCCGPGTVWSDVSGCVINTIDENDEE
jgi:hypothetical protein